MPTGTHALQRSIMKLAVTASKDLRASDARNAPTLIGDRAEQFQIKCSGRASDFPTYVTADLEFDQTFSVATGNRMSLLTRPQVYTGYEIETATTEAPPAEGQAPPLAGIILNAGVALWLLDDAGNIRGARVMCSALSPGDNVRFVAYVHITFQGFGALTEPPDSGD